jgi:hypothetical protein
MQIDAIPDFMADVYDLLYYVTSNDQIFRGNQSREVLPADNNYIVYTPIAQKRIGTNVVTFNAEGVDPEDNAPETNSKLLQIDLQVDFYGVNAFSFAEGLETFSKAGRCNDWLKQNGKEIRVLYATDPIDATLVDETHQYITRWYTVLSICLTASVTDPIPWIEEIEVIPVPKYDPTPGPTPDPPPSKRKGNKLVNVDVVYPPNDKE